jgi:hypothetical protein
MDPMKHEADEEEQAFLPQSSEDGTASSSPDSQRGSGTKSRRRQVIGYLRLLLEIAMAVTIICLVVFKPFVVARETIRRTPVPQRTLPHHSHVFGRSN